MDLGSCRVLRMMIQVNQAYSIFTPLRNYRILVIIIDVVIEKNARNKCTKASGGLDTT